VRLLAGVLVLIALVVRLGTGPFVDGVRRTDPRSLLAATAITLITTACCAWRWRLVADGLGVPIDARSSIAAVYRAQFLNATLPGGIVGDVDRALGHQRDGGMTGPGVRSVVWERVLGQVVQVALSAAVLVAVSSPVRRLGVVATAASAAAVVGLLLARRLLPAPAVRAVGADLRGILRTRRARLGIVAASAIAVAGHLLVFVLAARVAGVPATWTLLPVGALVLLASAVPLNVAGWGPREGVAAWAFGAAGLGAATGLTTAVVYGVMALVATLPGALFLLAGRRTWSASVRIAVPVLEEAARG
jgi:uncharacterized membrane protein YbhN (UPF0104 family)